MYCTYFYPILSYPILSIYLYLYILIYLNISMVTGQLTNKWDDPPSATLGHPARRRPAGRVRRGPEDPRGAELGVLRSGWREGASGDMNWGSIWLWWQTPRININDYYMININKALESYNKPLGLLMATLD